MDRRRYLTLSAVGGVRVLCVFSITLLGYFLGDVPFVPLTAGRNDHLVAPITPPHRGQGPHPDSSACPFT